MKRLVVVPSDAIEDYEKAGYSSWLEGYFNPCHAFEHVFALSPLEHEERTAYGLQIRPSSWRGFGSAVEKVRADVVRAYGGYWASDLAVSGTPSGIPVVVSVHDSAKENCHASIPLATAVLCTSQEVRDRVLELGTDENKIAMLPNRVDRSLFSRAGEDDVKQLARRFPPGRFILHVGRRSEQKNLETLIGALVHLPEDYRCVFVGRGDEEAYVEQAAALGVADRCHWVESVPSRELPIWMSWCDCFCVPSRWEGFGIVFIEAAACGAPIVTSNIRPMSEYLRDGESATLVDDYESPRAIAQAIERACEDAPFRARLRDGAVTAAEPFDKDAIDQLEANIYRSVASGEFGCPPSPMDLATFKLKTAASRSGRRLLRPFA